MTGRLDQARRIVVKIGSAMLVDAASGRLKADWLTSLAADIADLARGGREIIVVSSGAIALGRRTLGFKAGKLRLDESQAAAAVGQIALAHAWQQSLAVHDLTAGQVLLTLNDTEERRRYLNARATLNRLLSCKAVPVINENDTVATSEIRYGDNDRLAARVASMMAADCLVLLSDVDGLYTAPPDKPGAEHVAEVEAITSEIEAMAGRPVAMGMGSGGMITKIEAGKIATAAGARMVIAPGHELHPLQGLRDGGRATWFSAQANPAAARKRWIAGTLEPLGKIIVDDGAVAALATGKSLLPAGVRAVTGSFARGDTVSICNSDGLEIGRGLAGYDKADAERIIGCRSGEIEKRLGFAGRDVMVHRDDLVLMGSGT